ncbi:PR-1-like protein [Biscogniauxia mediterranea]|nr:PR-1-like protein [Biscogniauxia mediterranea]
MLAHTPTTLSIPILLLLLLLLAPPALSQTVTITIGPAAPTSAPEFVDGPTFTSAIPNSTNAYRSLYGGAAPPRWDATLEAYASRYLEEAGACAASFRHSGGPYGENLALGCVDAWGGEAAAYDFARPALRRPHRPLLPARLAQHVARGVRPPPVRGRIPRLAPRLRVLAPRERRRRVRRDGGRAGECGRGDAGAAG